MLGISPISYNSKSHAPSFGYSKADVDNDINFYKEQVDELDQFLNENIIPEKMKKPFKFFRVIANGAIDGLAVFGSTLMLAGFIKKSGAKINSNKYVKNTIDAAKPVLEKLPKTLTYIGEKISAGFDKLIKTDLYKKFAASKLGKRFIADASFLTVKGEDAIKVAMKPIQKIQNIDSDKAVKGTATVLGIGSGITGAYETTIRDDVKDEVDESDDRPSSRDYEQDYDYRESA